RSKRSGRRRRRSRASATMSRARSGSPDRGDGPNASLPWALLIEIEQPLDRGIDAREIGERKLGPEQELKRDAIDGLDLQLAAEGFAPGVAVDPAASAGRRNGRAVRLDMAVDLGASGGRRQHEGQELDQVALRGVALRELPVEHDNAGAKADVA